MGRARPVPEATGIAGTGDDKRRPYGTVDFMVQRNRLRICLVALSLPLRGTAGRDPWGTAKCR